MNLSEKLYIKYPTIIGKRLGKKANHGRKMIINLALYLVIFSIGILTGLQYSTTGSETAIIQIPDFTLTKDKEDEKDKDSTMVANK
jgi:hypothetical protein